MSTYSLDTVLTLDNSEIQKFIKGHQVIDSRLSHKDANLIVISKAPSIGPRNKTQYQITRAFILGHDQSSGLKIAVSVDYYGDEMEEALTQLLRVTS